MANQGYGQGRPEYGGATGQTPPGAGYPAQGETYVPPGGGYAGAGAAGQGMPYGGAGGYSAQQGASDAKGFVSSLFDFGFTSFVTPKVVKVVYALIVIVLGLGSLGLVLFAFLNRLLFGLLALIILAPLYFFISLALWRISLEIVMVVFRIAEDIRAIRAGGGPR